MSGHHPEQNAVSPDMHDAPDAWHDHSSDEMPQNAHGEVANAKVIIGVGLGAFFMVVLTIAIIYWYYTGYTVNLLNEQEKQGLEGPQLQRKSDIATELQGYNWAREGDTFVWIKDPGANATTGKNVVQIPLEAAKKKVIAEYTQKK